MNRSIEKIVEKQYEMIGENVKFSDIKDEIEIVVGKKKKKIRWFDHYKFKDEEQYLKWRNWAIEKLKENEEEDLINEVDMVFGIDYKREVAV